MQRLLPSVAVSGHDAEMSFRRPRDKISSQGSLELMQQTKAGCASVALPVGQAGGVTGQVKLGTLRPACLSKLSSHGRLWAGLPGAAMASLGCRLIQPAPQPPGGSPSSGWAGPSRASLLLLRLQQVILDSPQRMQDAVPRVHGVRSSANDVVRRGTLLAQGLGWGRGCKDGRVWLRANDEMGGRTLLSRRLGWGHVREYGGGV